MIFEIEFSLQSVFDEILHLEQKNVCVPSLLQSAVAIGEP